MWSVLVCSIIVRELVEVFRRNADIYLGCKGVEDIRKIELEFLYRSCAGVNRYVIMKLG